MIAQDLTTDQKKAIWERQNGMCALTGRKFEQFDDLQEGDYYIINPDLGNQPENIILAIKSGDFNPLRRASADGKIYLRRYLMPFANLANYDKNEFIKEIAIDIDTVAAMAADGNNLKDLRNTIKELIQILNSNPAPSDDKKELADKLNTALESVISRQKDEFEKIKAAESEVYNQLKVVVDEAIAFAKEATNFKSAREKLIAALNQYRKAKLSREHQEELLKLLNANMDDLNKRQTEDRENYEMECSENYHSLKSKVEDVVAKASVATHFKTARQTLIDMQNEIKDKKLKRNQREELYQIIRDCFDNVNKRQQEERQVNDVEYTENYNKIKKIVEDAIAFAENVTDNFKEAKDTLIAAQAAIKAINLRRSQKDELFASIRKVFDAVNERQNTDKEVYDKESDENYFKLKNKLEEAIVFLNNTSDFRLLRESMIAVQSEVRILKLKRDQRNELLDRIRGAFEVIDRLKNDYFDKRKNERVVKLNETISNLEMKIERLQESLSKDKEMLEELSKAISQTEDETAKTESEAKVKSIEEKIKEKEDRIQETRGRIEEIVKERESIK